MPIRLPWLFRTLVELCHDCFDVIPDSFVEPYQIGSIEIHVSSEPGLASTSADENTSRKGIQRREQSNKDRFGGSVAGDVVGEDGGVEEVGSETGTHFEGEVAAAAEADEGDGGGGHVSCEALE